MDLAQEKIDLIGKIVKADKKFSGHEDLYEDFLSETCRRAYVVVNEISSEPVLEAYLRKVVTTSILTVLKNSGRLRRTHDGYVSNKEILVETEKLRVDDIDYSSVNITYEVPVQYETPEDVAMKKEILQKVIDYVYAIHKSDTKKKYLEIYRLRYETGLTQKEIAKELKLSQSEVSKRLFKLMDRVKLAFN